MTTKTEAGNLARGPEGDLALFDDEFFRKLQPIRLLARRHLSGELPLQGDLPRRGKPGTLFRDYRRYVLGDDVRRIDWNVYGRLGELLVKLYELEGLLRWHILLDTSPSMRFPGLSKNVWSRRLAGALSFLGLSLLDGVRLVLDPGDARLNGRVVRGAGRASLLLDRLESQAVEGGQSALEALQAHPRALQGMGMAIVITDGYDHSELTRLLHCLRGAWQRVILVRCYDAREGRLALDGLVRIRDCETAEEELFDVTPDLRGVFEEVFREVGARTRRLCREVGAAYVEAPTTWTLEQGLRALLREGFVS